MKKKAIILFNKVSENATMDELDVLDQVELVNNELIKIGYTVSQVQLDLNLKEAINSINKIQPEFVFNLAETIENKGEFSYFAPAILNSINVPYTGVPLIPMFLTSNKVLTKNEFKRFGIRTPEYFSLIDLDKLKPAERYVLKPIWEEGSLGLDEDCVFNGNDTRFIENAKKKNDKLFFIEQFIDGREFNISILGGKEKPEVLPLAEMKFYNYPEGKPKIVGYTAKWKEDSFEYLNSRRTFDVVESDKPLLDEISNICTTTWNAFGLKGYARLDFRVDNNNIPYVLEVNSNPCISENGGFYPATLQAGYSFTDVIQRIIDDALKK